jgi:hypothetical protein
MNRVRYGAEGAIVGKFFTLGGKTLQQAYKYMGRPVGEPMLRMGFNVAGAGFKGTSWLLAKIQYCILKFQEAWSALQNMESRK